MAAAIIVVTSQAGCKRKAVVTLPDSQDEFSKRPLSKSPAIQVNFYMDATVPLRGFLTATKEGQHNYFTEVLNKAIDILSESWNDTTVKVWRFGERDPSLEDGLMRFKSAREFTDVKTYIDKAIQHQPAAPGGRPQLKIILTDLFQNDNAVGSLAKELDDRYLKDDSLAVGILAVRSVFSGSMDDLPGKVPATAADSLPFYLLLAGPIADVRLAMKRLVDGLPIAENDRFEMVFAHRMVDRLGRPLNAEPAESRAGFTMKPDLVPGAEERNIPAFGNVRHDVKLRLIDFPHPEISALGPHISVASQTESIRVQATAFAAGQHPQADPKAASALTFELGAKAKLMVIDRSKLADKTIYLFQVDLLGERGQLANMGKWGLESDERDRVVSRQEFDKDENGNRPGKTPNLRHFLNVLALKMFQSDIRLSRYYFYVETN